MRRIAFVAALLACTGACVRVEPVDTAPPHRGITYRRPEPTTPHERSDSVSESITAGRRQADSTYRAWMPASGRISPRWTTIVIHHSATARGGAKVFDRNHRKRGWDELGYHFVIGNGTYTPDGFVEVGPRWKKQKHGAHCKTPDNYYNEHGIGICLVGDFTKSKPTQGQLASLERLVRFLGRTCRIPPSRVIAHNRVNKKTQCPGSRLSLAALRQWLATPPTASSMP